MKSLSSFLFGLALFCLVTLPAKAASVDLSPIVNIALELTNAVLVPLIVIGITLLAKKVGLDKVLADAAMNRMLHDGIQRGVDSLEGVVRSKAFKNGAVTVDVGSEAVATVANRMSEFSPDLLKRLGVTEAALKRLIAEKLGPVAA